MSASKSKKKAPKLSVDEQMKKDLDSTKFLADWGFTGPNPNNCHRCGIHNSMIDGYMLQCAKCKLVYYCSMNCFNVDLESHRQLCDSGKLQSDVERVTLFDLPKTPTEEAGGTKEQSSKSPRSPKTPRLLGNTKPSVGASLSAQKEKAGKKKVSPKKATKSKVSPKKTLKTKDSDGAEGVGAEGGSLSAAPPAVPFANAEESVDLAAGEGLQSPTDVCLTREPKPQNESSPEIVLSPSVEGSVSRKVEPEVSVVESEHVIAPPATEIPSIDDGNNPVVDQIDAPLEPQVSNEKLSEPISEVEATNELETEVTTATTGEITVSPSFEDEMVASHVSLPPALTRESSAQETSSDDNDEPAHPEPDSVVASRDNSYKDESSDDESSSCGAELSPLRSSRNWSEDDDVVIATCQDPIPNLPTLDLSTASAHAASVSTVATEEEQNELVEQQAESICEEDGDESEGTIIEYEEVLIEVQTYRASGSADTSTDHQEDGNGQSEKADCDAASGDAYPNLTPPNTEDEGTLENHYEAEASEESDASSSTIIEYEEVIIDEEVYRSAGSVPTESSPPADVNPPEASVGHSLDDLSEGEALNNPSLESEGQLIEHPEPLLEHNDSDGGDVSPNLLPTETTGQAASSSEVPSESRVATKSLQPLEGIAAQRNEEEGSAPADDDSAASDTTILEYEEVIIDEDWWGVSGNVNCLDGIVYELSEEVVSRKSGSVNVAGDPSDVANKSPGGKVRRFRLTGPTSSGRYFLRPIEGESETGNSSWVAENEEDDGVEPDTMEAERSAKSGSPYGSSPQGRRSRDGALGDHSTGSYRKLRVGEGSIVGEQEGFVREVVDLKPVSPLTRPKDDASELRERIALRPTPPSPKQVAPERDPSFVSKRSSLKEAPRTQPKSPAEIRDFSFIKKRSNLKETSPPPKKNVRAGGEHYLVFDKERKAYILRSLTGAKDAAEARDVVVLRPVKPSPKRQFEFEKPEWVKKSPIRNRGSLEGLLGQSYGNLGHSVADLNSGEPPSPRTPSRREEGDDDQSLGSFQELGNGSGDADRAMDQSGETIYVLEDGGQDATRRPRPARAAASGSRTTAGANVVLRPSPGSPTAKKVESKLPSWAIKSPLKTTERGLMMKSFSDLSKLGNASFSTMGSSEQTFAKPTRKSSAAYKYVSPHRYKGDYMNSMATMIEASYEPNESEAAECKTLRSMPEL